MALCAGLALTACGSSTPSKTASGPSKPVAQEVRDLDVAEFSKAASQASYDKAFKTLSGRCNEQGVGLGNEVGAVLKLLEKQVHDETRLTVMQHMAQSIPAGQKMKCSEVGGAYVTLRAG